MLVLPKILHTISFKYCHAYYNLIIAFGSSLCIQCCRVEYQRKGQKGQKSVGKFLMVEVSFDSESCYHMVSYYGYW
jgi:hypothetical protein